MPDEFSSAFESGLGLALQASQARARRSLQVLQERQQAREMELLDLKISEAKQLNAERRQENAMFESARDNWLFDLNVLGVEPLQATMTNFLPLTMRKASSMDDGVRMAIGLAEAQRKRDEDAAVPLGQRVDIPGSDTFGVRTGKESLSLVRPPATPANSTTTTTAKDFEKLRELEAQGDKEGVEVFRKKLGLSGLSREDGILLRSLYARRDKAAEWLANNPIQARETQADADSRNAHRADLRRANEEIARLRGETSSVPSRQPASSSPDDLVPVIAPDGKTTGSVRRSDLDQALREGYRKR
jgi:hypothetical protein